MKKLFILSLIFGFAAITSQASLPEKVNACTTVDKIGPEKTSAYAFFRLDRVNKEVYLAFYGPATKLGDDVTIKIYNSSSGALMQQEFMTAHGGGMVEHFSISGLEAGSYSVVVTGDIYNLTQPFILE